MRNPILVGRRVYLTAEEEADVRPTVAGMAQERDTFVTGGFGRFLHSPLMWDQLWEEQAAEETSPKEVLFTVRLKESDEFMGVVGLDTIDWINKTAETMSWLRDGEGTRGQGYGTEAKMLLLGYAFETLGLHLICSNVHLVNKRSAAALAKQGYKSAGVLKYTHVKYGEYSDELQFDLTYEDWLAAKERWEASL